jgi:DNA-binding transcriptional MerR regulator
VARRLSTLEVSRILDMREARVRDLVRAGLVRPARRGRGYAFSFQDLVVLRAAQELLDRHVPAARVRRALAGLAASLPEGRPLSGLRVFADGREVAVRDESTTWQPATGQIVLDFAVDDLVRRAEGLGRAGDGEAVGARPAGDAARARACFERALDLEDEDPEAARDAYREALALDPGLVDACVNLGRLAHEAGDTREAARLYHLALERSPEDAIVHFNLALVLEDQRAPERALAHYQRALAIDPDFADAHFNLAGLCEQLGREAQALRHYHAYKKLTSG